MRNHRHIKDAFLPQYITYNNGFTPCPTAEGDELYRNGVFEFNISRMIHYLKHENTAFKSTDIDISNYYKGFSSITESHVDSANLEHPVIVAEISPGRYNLIDGNHRAEKARRLGVLKLPCYRIEAVQHIPFLTSKHAYSAYIEYWNEKVNVILKS